MSAKILDGLSLARLIQEEIKPKISSFSNQYGRQPCLGIVLVGNDPASEVYVRNKLKVAAGIGFRADLERLPSSTTLKELLSVVEKLNQSSIHDGILVQSPLPKEMGPEAAQAVFDKIMPSKDVDGFSPTNVGLLVQKRPSFVACTPAGIIELLLREKIPIAGQHAVIIGRSDIVGKPMATLLLHRNATVTVCHSKTVGLSEVCRQGDILVVAIGRPGLVTTDFIKPGATVIDVGMNRVTDPATAVDLLGEGHPRLTLFRERGSVLVGDVHPRVVDIAGAMTPVPGGVGPLTITMLMRNTLNAAQMHVMSAR